MYIPPMELSLYMEAIAAPSQWIFTSMCFRDVLYDFKIYSCIYILKILAASD